MIAICLQPLTKFLKNRGGGVGSFPPDKISCRQIGYARRQRQAVAGDQACPESNWQNRRLWSRQDPVGDRQGRPRLGAGIVAGTLIGLVVGEDVEGHALAVGEIITHRSIVGHLYRNGHRHSL